MNPAATLNPASGAALKAARFFVNCFRLRSIGRALWVLAYERASK